PYWWQCLVLLGGLLIEVLFETGLRMSSKVLIDEAIEPRSYTRLSVILLVLGIAAVVATASMVLCAYLWARAGARGLNAIRQQMFGHLQRLSMEFYGRAQIGDILARFESDLRSVERGLVIALPAGIIAAGNILLGAGLLFELEWRLAAMTVATLPVCLLGPWWLGPRAVAAHVRAKEEDARLANLI